ncbi:MAG: Bax inhibitor-1/YccA family protein [Phycisphaera sp.]|nr:MAG: Bax inhibitor-1/YccA family protein [Phycisphaera sp.]
MIQSTGNPAIQKVDQYLNPAGSGDWARDMAAPKVMTYQGAVTNTAILLGLTVGTAGLLWSFAADAWLGLLIGGAVVGLVLALVIIFKPRLSPFLAPVYAIAEGAFVAGASFLWASIAADRQAAASGGGGGAMAQLDTSLIAQAAGLTFAITAVMLALYATRIIRATPLVMRMIIVATGGVLLFALANILLGVFLNKPLVSWDGGPLSIAISAAIVGIAAFNLIIDFKIVEDGVANKAPKWMEWYAGFALLVTIVWLYVSILRLLAMLRGGE